MILAYFSLSPPCSSADSSGPSVPATTSCHPRPSQKYQGPNATPIRLGELRSLTDTPRPGQTISERLLWKMTIGTGNLAVGAQAFVEEKAMTQFCRARVVRHLIAWVRRQLGQTADPLLSQQ